MPTRGEMSAACWARLGCARCGGSRRRRAWRSRVLLLLLGCLGVAKGHAKVDGGWVCVGVGRVMCVCVWNELAGRLSPDACAAM